MWICKHCEMMNEDTELECFLCGKPQKEPENIKEKTQQSKPASALQKQNDATQPFATIRNDVAQKPQQTQSAPRQGFIFHVHEKIGEPIVTTAEQEENLADFEHLQAETPDYSAFVTPLAPKPRSEQSGADIFRQFIGNTAPHPTEAQTPKEDRPFFEPFDPNANTYRWKPSDADHTQVPPQAEPIYDDTFDPNAHTYRWKPSDAPKAQAEQKAATSDPVADLRKILAQISNQAGNTDVTEEIRQKNEERRRNTAADNTPLPDNHVQKQPKPKKKKKRALTPLQLLGAVAVAAIVVMLIVMVLIIADKISTADIYNIKFAVEEILYEMEANIFDAFEINIPLIFEKFNS